MSPVGPISERALILAPRGRDAAIAGALLREGGLTTALCRDLDALTREVEAGAGLAIVTDEALQTADLRPLAERLAAQASWSDFPFVILTRGGAGPDRNPAAQRLSTLLGNVSFVERPFHPTSLLSVVRAALRGRRRQYEARARMEELHRREEQLRVAQEAGGVGSFELLPGSGEVAMSPPCARLWGVEGRLSIGRDAFLDLVHPEDRRAVRDAADGPAECTLDYLEHRIVRPDTGEVRWVARRGEAVRDESGTLRCLGVTWDITARKQVEERLRELNATLEQRVVERTAERDRIWAHSTELMVVADLEGRPRSVNPAWQRILGYADSEVIGRPLVDLVHPEDAGRAGSALASLRAGDGLTTFEGRLLRADSRPVWIAWTAVATPDAIYAIGRDVTEQRTVEEQLRHSQKMEAVGQLTGGIAHDFNNLLQGITGSLDLMGRRIRQGRIDELDRFLTGAVTSANRAAALTHRLLAFSRRQPLDPKPVDVDRLIDAMEDFLRRTIGPAITLERVQGDKLWWTLCDGNQLENAVLNLCINARDAMPDGGRLTIETANATLDDARVATVDNVRPGRYVTIVVRDTGTGMTPETVVRAFDPFFTTKPLGQGTGLGLSMIYGFARQSEGHAAISSAVGVGTAVTLYLPGHRGRAVDPVHAPTEAAAPARSQAGEVVLVVEDEGLVRSLIVDVLRELGCQALEAANGPAAIAILEGDGRIDLLVTDIGLPEMNGHQLAAIARRLRPDLKVLFVTGYEEHAPGANIPLPPGTGLVTKPFSLETLAGRIRAMVEAA